MPRSEEAFRQIRDDRREQILEAAASVFARNGYVGTRIDDIASHAGISKGLVYHYFGSKEVLFNTLVEGAARGTVRLFTSALERPESAAARLRWLVEREVGGMAGDRDRIVVVLHAMLSDASPQEARAVVSSLIAQVEAMTLQLIAEGQREGHIAAGDPQQLALLLGACIQGLAVSAATSAVTPTLPTSESLMQLILRPSAAN